MAETKVCPMVGGYLLPWKHGVRLPSSPLSLTFFLPLSLPPSFFCTSTLSSLRWHVLGIWARVSFVQIPLFSDGKGAP